MTATSSAEVFSATNADGTTETQTVINDFSDNLIGAVKDGTTNIKFYVDGVLKATHMTNLPTTFGAYMGGFAISNRGIATDTIWSIRTWSCILRQD